ncbi:MAG: hypothetical protein HGB32_16065 [Geobacteraceae bacterium]|nr:hypothetical protein [Geobacteraceae bacterium]NTW81635.1 hypothetical protein [Geobacteraceae bacterium]
MSSINIEIIRNGKRIDVKKGRTSCAFGTFEFKQEPCITCERTSTKEIPCPLWLLDPNFGNDDEGDSAPTSSSMLPRQQRIGGQTTVKEAVSTLRDYAKKVDINIWNRLILQFIIELQKLQEDEFIPAPSSEMSDTELSGWLIILRQHNKQPELQKLSAYAVPVQNTSEVKPSPVVIVTVVSDLTQSEALPIQEKNNSTPQQPTFVFDYPAMSTAELTEFTDFVQRMKNIADDILVKLCQIASDFGKLSIQNAEGRLTNEKYNQMTDDQERRVKEIAPTAKFDYNTCQILIGDQPIPEIAKSQFVKPQEQGKLAPAPRHGPKL